MLLLINSLDVQHMEGLLPKTYGADAVEIPGSRKLLEDLEKACVPWAIVTSGTRPLVTGWIEVMKLAHPKNLVTAEDVQQGKPDPACYVLGRERLSLSNATEMLVLEDAPAGVRAGKAAGFKVVALATTHGVKELKEAGADWIVRDMRSVGLKKYDRKTGNVSVEFCDAVVE